VPRRSVLQVLHGRVQPTSPDTRWDGRPGDRLVIPATRHGLHAVDDSVVLLTVAKAVQRYRETTDDDDPGDHIDSTDL
jgi:quercetin dioxygenase-like cupin family protein